MEHSTTQSIHCTVAKYYYVEEWVIQEKNALEDYTFLDQIIEDIRCSLDSVSRILFKLLKWIHHLMSLIQLPLYYLQGFVTNLVPFLIVLIQNWLLALNLINYGTMLGFAFAWVICRYNVSHYAYSPFYSNLQIWN